MADLSLIIQQRSRPEIPPVNNLRQILPFGSCVPQNNLAERGSPFLPREHGTALGMLSGTGRTRSHERGLGGGETKPRQKSGSKLSVLQQLRLERSSRWELCRREPLRSPLTSGGSPGLGVNQETARTEIQNLCNHACLSPAVFRTGSLNTSLKAQ